METADSPAIEAPPRRPLPRIGRAGKVAAVVAGVLLIMLIAVWSARKPIAAGVIDRAMASRGVPARYQIQDLSLGRQRLGNLVIGDPANPDLVADWVELTTGIGLTGPGVTGVRAGHVRMRARVVGGKLSLGAIDKLMPASSGKPFTLPKLRVDVGDVRMRLETPQGVVGLKLAGSGRLDDGFAGQFAAVSDRLELGSCAAGRVTAFVAIRIAKERPRLSGPVRAAKVACGDTRIAGARVTIDATLGAALDRWSGKADVAVSSISQPFGKVADLSGSVSFDGAASRTAGRLDLRSGTFSSAQLSGATLALAGSYRFGDAFAFAGTAGAERATISPAMRQQLASLGKSGAGTPLAPLAAKLGYALARAGQSMSLTASIGAGAKGQGGEVRLTRADVRAATGATVTFAGDGLRYAWPTGATRIDGRLALAAGGLPEGEVTLAQAVAGAPVIGTATFRPYAAAGASLSLTPVRFIASPRGNTVFGTRITLSGPVGNGRVDGLTFPVSGLWDGERKLVFNADCAALGFDRLAVSGLVLNPARVRLCPVGGAIVRIDRNRIGGGARIDATRLSGRLGSSPIALGLSGGRIGIADGSFTANGVAVRICTVERMTKLDFGRLDGGFSARGLSGSFAYGGGQIANVPLLMSGAAGRWTLSGGKLALTGDLSVADASPEPRFAPLAGKGVKLALVDGVITATGILATPTDSIKIADVAIIHDLSSGTGHADLRVPGITFGKVLQPDRLTRLTYGVIADVKGTVAGEGHIAWTPEGVTSNGVFRTDKTDLAAAFGPVTGISGEVHFTDLLNLVTAPGQVATVATVNPGIPVENGVIRYRLLAGSRIEVEGGRWPFAGGELALEPTVLDFSQAAERHMTFRVTGLDAQQFLQQFSFDNLNATGIFDGVLPMTFDENGGRIEEGHLTVREGGGTIAYVGEITQKDVGFWGNVAFQALKALRYRSLDIVMNGPLAGAMVTEVRFAGISQGEGTSHNFLIKRLTKLPFVFNVRIQAPFRGLIDSARSFYDPSRLIQRNLPALLRAQQKAATPAARPIQPTESEKLP
ncbi:YdbH domain-containing protein [soil metagenome]